MSKKNNEPFQVEADKALTGVLALLIAEREERGNGKAEPRKTEVILADAGLGLSEIAALTGKNYETVKTTVRRSRQKK